MNAPATTAGEEHEAAPMIKLTHLGGEAFILNAELIRYVEARPDTFITLTGGDRVVVRESMDDVLQRAIEYHRSKHFIPPPNYLASSCGPACTA
jgi:flagellar protein FlbD